MFKKVFLASKSPRRKELLLLMGIEHQILLKDVDESFPETLALRDVAEYIAKKKAKAFEILPESIIITADTVVILGAEILGKPANRTEALSMLKKLSGNMHLVVTGVTIKTANKEISFSDTTEVYFKEISDSEIEHYVDEFQPYDKAGSYGIQEWFGLVAIQKIVGSYTNVMGLPTEKLYENLKLF